MAQVHFRMSDERLAFIDRAAAIRGVTGSEYVLSTERVRGDRDSERTSHHRT